MARTSRPVPSAGLHALLFVHDILSDAPTAPASLTTSNASNTVSVSGPPRVLEANKDETPSVVNEGAPEDEHQPPPGTLAADTSEHPESQPEGSHASPPTIISGQSDATQLNPLALKLLYFIRRANGGMGMAEVDINGLLQLVVEPGLAHLVTSELRNSKDLERFEMERLAGLNRGWSVATFEIDGHPPQRLLFQNSAQDLNLNGPTTVGCKFPLHDILPSVCTSMRVRMHLAPAASPAAPRAPPVAPAAPAPATPPAALAAPAPVAPPGPAVPPAAPVAPPPTPVLAAPPVAPAAPPAAPAAPALAAPPVAPVAPPAAPAAPAPAAPPVAPAAPAPAAPAPAPAAPR
ncbi:unnamed protein product [Closterium sp. NIES-54]